MTTEKKYQDMKMFVIVLLVLNVLLGVYIAFFKTDAYSLETLKAGGRENMNMARQLYKSDMYVQQQKTTLEQILNSMNQAAVPAQADATGTLDLPTVAQ